RRTEVRLHRAEVPGDVAAPDVALHARAQEARGRLVVAHHLPEHSWQRGDARRDAQPLNRMSSVAAVRLVGRAGFLRCARAGLVSSMSWSLGLKMIVSLSATSMLFPVRGCL